MRLSYIFNSFITSIEAINWKDPFKWFVSIIGAIMVYLFGGWDWYMWALVGFVIADLITGISAAYKEGNLDSKKLKKGALSKVSYFAVVFVAYYADLILSGGGAVRALAIIYLMATEGLSILENASRCGAPIPPKLMAALEQLKGDD